MIFGSVGRTGILGQALTWMLRPYQKLTFIFPFPWTLGEMTSIIFLFWLIDWLIYYQKSSSFPYFDYVNHHFYRSHHFPKLSGSSNERQFLQFPSIVIKTFFLISIITSRRRCLGFPIPNFFKFREWISVFTLNSLISFYFWITICRRDCDVFGSPQALLWWDE